MAYERLRLADPAGVLAHKALGSGMRPECRGNPRVGVLATGGTLKRRPQPGACAVTGAEVVQLDESHRLLRAAEWTGMPAARQPPRHICRHIAQVPFIGWAKGARARQRHDPVAANVPAAAGAT